MKSNFSTPTRTCLLAATIAVATSLIASFCNGQVKPSFRLNASLKTETEPGQQPSQTKASQTKAQTGSVDGSSANFKNVNAKPTEFYTPIEKQMEGWTVVCDPKLLSEESKEEYEPVFKALANHLQRITFMLPADRLKRIQQCRIWIEVDNPLLKGMQYHPGRGWLLSKKLDPRLVKHVHIPQAKALTDRVNWAKHPYVILHELAHSYHDQVFGFNDKSIKEVFDAAKESKTYEKVMDHRGRTVRHYGLNNQMEYFAESTEAYLGVNDFFPFVRAELKQHDPKMYDLMKKIWGKVD